MVKRAKHFNRRGKGVLLRKYIKNVVKGISETKSTNQDYTPQNIPDEGLLNELTYIPTGTGKDERIGSLISPVKIYGQINLYRNTAGGATSYVRFLIVKSLRGPITSVSQVLTSYYGAASIENVVVLYDRTFVICPQYWDSQASTARGTANGGYHLNVKLNLQKQKVVRYNLDTDEESVNNGYYLVAMGNADNAVDMEGFMTFYYKDM